MPSYTDATPATPLRTLFGQYASATFKASSLTELDGITAMTTGDLAYVVSLGGAVFQYRGGWKQITEARVTTLAVLNTAYGVLGGKYLVDGAQAILTSDPLTTLQYSATGGTGSWYPSSGRVAPYSFAAGTAATPAAGVLTVNLPGGRFLVAPDVTATLGVYVANAQVLTDQISKDSFRISTFNISTGAALAVGTIRWQAVQMTPTNGDG